MTKSKIFLYSCLSLIMGVFLNSFIPISQIYTLGILILGILLISVLWPYKKPVLAGFFMLFFTFGIWFEQGAEFEIKNDLLIKLNDSGQKITLIGIVVQEPDIKDKNTKLTVKVENNNLPIKGKILATVNRYPEYRYGDKLKITGKLETPKNFEGFNYGNYLAKNGILSVMYLPKIKVIEKNQGNPVFAGILRFKNKLRKSVYQNLSPPQSSILGSMILGDKRKISEEWKQKLNIAGVRHITAISGLHVAVLTAILMTLLLALGFWRKQAFYLAIVIIALFIIMTGFQPSAVRAGIMGGLVLLGQHLGRLSVSSRAIVFVAALMLIQNPLLLRYDIGFQLSFLAMIGIIYLLPAFQDWLKFIPEKNLKDILAMTFSAYIFTLPILIYSFGLVSLITPITNILIVPMLYWIMIFGFIFGLAGMISPFSGWIFSFPAWFLLTYLTKTVDWFSSFPQAAMFFNISWVWLVVSYLILGYFTWRLNERRKLKFLEY